MRLIYGTGPCGPYKRVQQTVDRNQVRGCFREKSLPRELASVFMSERRKASGESDEGLRQTEEQKQVRVTLLLNLQISKEAPDLQ